MPRRNKTPLHQPFEHKNTCQTKRRFKTQAQAKETAEHQMLINMNLELSTYKCEQCGFWHLTRQSKTT